MSTVRESIESAVRYLSENPEKARYTDSYARATLGESLRVEVQGPSGETLTTDMPRGVGGHAEHPTPGWLFRAAIASCVASTVGMEAARQGVAFESLEVEVDSESDDRGILAMDASVPVGPISTRIHVRGTASGVDPEHLRGILDRGASLCPVCDATKRAVEVTVEVEAAGP